MDLDANDPKMTTGIRRLTLMPRSSVPSAFSVLSLVLSAATAMGKNPPAAAIGGLDKNGDGRISMEEFKATGPPPLHPRMKQVFDAMDKEHAGSLTYEDTGKVIATVSGVMPKMKPDLGGSFTPVGLEVNPRTNRAFVKVTINGLTGTFLFDTGTSDTIIHPDFARRAGVDFVEICQTITAGNMGKPGDSVSLVRIPELAMGDGRFKDFHAVLRNAKSASYETGGPIDGVLGGNVIFAKPVTLDFAQGRISYEPMEAAQADMSFQLLKDAARVPAVEADIDGVTVRLMFDSGAAINDALLINEGYHTAFRQLAGDPAARTYTARSVRVGGHEILRQIPCLLKPFEWSVAGSMFFNRHLITVDLQAGKLLIRQNAPSSDKQTTRP
ncbi:MAG: aspartyl protease family protein [Luteolibacter sp.]